MKKLYKLLRVEHYIKNFIIFAPLLFTTRFENTTNILKTFETLVMFSNFVVNNKGAKIIKFLI